MLFAHSGIIYIVYDPEYIAAKINKDCPINCWNHSIHRSLYIVMIPVPCYCTRSPIYAKIKYDRKNEWYPAEFWQQPV